jgi:hypothetical protein
MLRATREAGVTATTTTPEKAAASRSLATVSTRGSSSNCGEALGRDENVRASAFESESPFAASSHALTCKRSFDRSNGCGYGRRRDGFTPTNVAQLSEPLASQVRFGLLSQVIWSRHNTVVQPLACDVRNKENKVLCYTPHRSALQLDWNTTEVR